MAKVDDQRVAITGSSALVAGVVGTPALWVCLQHDQLLSDRALDPSQLCGFARLMPGEARVLSRQQHRCPGPRPRWPVDPIWRAGPDGGGRCRTQATAAAAAGLAKVRGA
jgi:hypothetical protein